MQVQSIVNFVPNATQEGYKVLSPATGQVDKVDISKDSSQAFCSVGEGVLVKLEGQIISSPVNGKVIELIPALGKVVVQAKNKMRFLLQLSFRHIEHHGLGLKQLVKQGQLVEAGQPLLQLDLYKIKLQIKPVTLYFLLLDYQHFKAIETSKRQVEAGLDPIFSLIPKQAKS